MTAWDPGHYESFLRERWQPGLDLINRIHEITPRVIVDLGCGTGRLTHELASRFPQADTVGIDRSREMVAQAPAGPARFEIGDIETWQPGSPVDVVFANASLHWIPNHRQLFVRLLQAVAPDGALAVQMPLSWDLPSHRVMRTVAADYGVHIEEPPTLAPTDYLDVLLPESSRLDVWTTTYLHVLSGDNPVFHWVSATGIKRFLGKMDERHHEVFLSRCAEEVRRQYPRRADGHTHYPFERLFIVARR